MADTTASSVKVAPDHVLDTIGKHMLVDGFPIVVDLEKSGGSRLVDERDGRSYLDFFQFFASAALGFNHPRLLEDDFLKTLAKTAVNKPSNSDFYTTVMAEFVETADRCAIPKELPRMFLISGGALAVENALKAAFDWKVRKNKAKGVGGEVGQQVIHFREAFHGRTGYTMSLTNTDPTKTDYYPKFNWPRVSNPKIRTPLADHLDDVIAAEKKSQEEIKQAIHTHGDDIAALLIEPIQGEGGDNHFRPEFLRFLREVTEENDIILVLDEVQTGLGLTGKYWAYEHAGITPDVIAFGKKMQVCGIMASEKFNEVDSVFKVPSRINSTWGGCLTDMLRATRYMQVIEDDNLVENARVTGEYLLGRLDEMRDRYPDVVSNTRGSGLMCAFDLPSGEMRDNLSGKCKDNGMLVVGCGPNSLRFRPALIITKDEVDEAMDIIDRSIKALRV